VINLALPIEDLRGGKTVPANLQMLRRHCNGIKSDHQARPRFAAVDILLALKVR
jgi:hypothetical protein